MLISIMNYSQIEDPIKIDTKAISENYEKLRTILLLLRTSVNVGHLPSYFFLLFYFLKFTFISFLKLAYDHWKILA